jgi:hypothetical protein
MVWSSLLERVDETEISEAAVLSAQALAEEEIAELEMRAYKHRMPPRETASAAGLI